MYGGTRPPNCPFSGGTHGYLSLPESTAQTSFPEDKKKEDIHVQDALRTCGYPEWSFQKARRQMKQMKPKKKKKNRM